MTEHARAGSPINLGSLLFQKFTAFVHTATRNQNHFRSSTDCGAHQSREGPSARRSAVSTSRGSRRKEADPCCCPESYLPSAQTQVLSTVVEIKLLHQTVRHQPSVPDYQEAKP